MTNFIIILKEYHFNNCTCVMESFVNSTSVNNNTLANAVNGNCDTDCNRLWIYFVFLGLLIYLLLVIHIPYFYATLRLVIILYNYWELH